MTIQVIQRTGGRRFGPTAMAAQARGTAPAVPARGGGVPVAGASGRTGTVPPRPGRLYRHGRMAAPADRQRPRGAAVDYRRRPAGPACPTGSAGGGYRMGRWARLAMTLIVTAAIVVGTLTVVMRPGAVPTRFVTVQPGEDLISVVLRTMPGWDPARAIDEIESLNHLDGPAVDVGTVLRVPDAGGSGGR